MSLQAEIAATAARKRNTPTLKEMMKGLKEKEAHQKGQLKEMRVKGGLISDFRICCHAWIQRIDYGTPEEIAHMRVEMKKMLKKIERTLNEAGV